MKCRQATRLISDAQEQTINDQRKNWAQFCNLSICTHCRKFQRNCNTLRKLMKDFKG